MTRKAVSESASICRRKPVVRRIDLSRPSTAMLIAFPIMPNRQREADGVDVDDQFVVPVDFLLAGSRIVRSYVRHRRLKKISTRFNGAVQPRRHDPDDAACIWRSLICLIMFIYAIRWCNPTMQSDDEIRWCNLDNAILTMQSDDAIRWCNPNKATLKMQSDNAIPTMQSRRCNPDDQ